MARAAFPTRTSDIGATRARGASSTIRRMQTTGVVQQKGGVGKTGLAVGTAGALAERGRRVLLGDLDPQGHATVSALRMARVPQDAPSLAAALAGDYDGPAKDLVVRHSTTPAGGVLDVLPTSLKMFTAARDLDKRPDRERQLGRLLEELATDRDLRAGLWTIRRTLVPTRLPPDRGIAQEGRPKRIRAECLYSRRRARRPATHSRRRREPPTS